MELDKINFLGIEDCAYDQAKISVIQVPLEKTTSYQKGTSFGPQKIVEASKNVEEYDIETKTLVSDIGIYNMPVFDFEKVSLKESLVVIENAVAREVENGHFPLILGGEHSLSLGVYRGLSKKYSDIGVIAFDAHADLRESYENEKFSHACVMRRIRDHTQNTCGVGIRSYCIEEARYIDAHKVDIVPADHFFYTDKGQSLFEKILKKMPENIFITFDIDVFDPSIIPSTGTPEPGGLDWYQCTSMLKKIFVNKNVIGVDIVELMPESSKVSDFIAAKLAVKVMAYFSLYSSVPSV